MTYPELMELEERIKSVYNFKYDKEALKEVIMKYSLTDVINAYKTIISNTPKLTGLNIILELKNELFSIKPEFKIKKEYKHCEFCQGSGLISMIDDSKYRTAFACNCENGDFKAKNLKLMNWNGRNSQIYKNKNYIVEVI